MRIVKIAGTLFWHNFLWRCAVKFATQFIWHNYLRAFVKWRPLNFGQGPIQFCCAERKNAYGESVRGHPANNNDVCANRCGVSICRIIIRCDGRHLRFVLLDGEM
jgi:hypothetical protein